MYKKSLFHIIPIAIMSAVFCDAFASQQALDEQVALQTSPLDPVVEKAKADVQAAHIKVLRLEAELNKSNLEVAQAEIDRLEKELEQMHTVVSKKNSLISELEKKARRFNRNESGDDSD